MLVDKGLTKSPVALGDLHYHLDRVDMDVDDFAINRVSAEFYETSDAFVRLYHRFIRDVLLPLDFAPDLYFQKTPTIRFHFPETCARGPWEFFHNDSMLGHPPTEINVWMPMTDAGRSGNFVMAGLQDSLTLLERFDFDPAAMGYAIWDDDDLKAQVRAMCHPVTLRYGEALVFDPRCIHGAIPNRGDVVRVSLDFRVIDVAELDGRSFDYRGTGRRRARFVPGDYYHEHSIASEHFASANCN